jgi:hypothetical protein
MQTQPQVYSFSLYNTGVDWLTATAKAGGQGRPFRALGNALRDKERAAGGDVVPATLRDYAGHRGDGFFYGARSEDSIIILSGPRAAAHWREYVAVASNVSRLDLQVTLWTHGEQPHIAREAYHRLRRLPAGRGRPRSLTLIQSHPRGETLNIGRRTSDAYGRCYDWAAAHTKEEARTIWRYEVEYKRHYAARKAAALSAASCARTFTSLEVKQWFEVRGLPVPFDAGDARHSDEASLKEANRDVLRWMEESLSKTIAKQINRHGLTRVLSALGLSDKVIPRPQRRCTADADSAGALPTRRNR